MPNTLKPSKKVLFKTPGKKQHVFFLNVHKPFSLKKRHPPPPKTLAFLPFGLVRRQVGGLAEASQARGATGAPVTQTETAGGGVTNEEKKTTKRGGGVKTGGKKL